MDREFVGSSLAKIPLSDSIPLNIELTSISQNPMFIKSIKLDLLNNDLFELLSPALAPVETLLDEKDSYSEQFLLKPLRPVSDTKNYGDITVEWSRDLENAFNQICRFPISPVSII